MSEFNELVMCGELQRLRERVDQLERENRSAELFVKEMLVRCADAMNTRGMIDKLREPEGASVTLMNDNPDFNGQPNCAVEVIDDWTGWRERRFTGDTLAAALCAAIRARTSHGQGVGT